MRVHLHRAQRDFLLGCFESSHPPVRGGPSLLAAVQSAGLVREHCNVKRTRLAEDLPMALR
ncbi:hypothetical protein ACFRIC_38890 [Streptomyces sp. NPDC056738]|uniref:hypothetical protein n=1 Tax=Streptomyces sp. NPDC056738 TaxID=3345933 RepID=UPI0036BD1320